MNPSTLPTAATRVRADLSALIGNTPLVRLRAASAATGCEILGKAEWLNPGGSIKDRTALGLLQDAERRGLLAPDTVLVEGTAGNTGIGLALVGASLGYRSIIVMPETQSAEKIAALRMTGAEVRLVPAVAYANPDNYVHRAQRLTNTLNAERERGAWFANQFDNTANRDFHQATTGAEIWRQTGGQIDGFVCSAGTGGTLAGVARALRAQAPDVHIALADPTGSSLAHFVAHGSLQSAGNSITQGIGSSRITANFADTRIDHAWSIPDTESIPLLHRLVTEEGLCLGGSSGVNVAGALRLARALGPGHVIVTVLCDAGTRYRQSLFNPALLAAKEIPVPAWLARTNAP